MDIYSKQFEVTLSDVGENNQLSDKGILRMMQEIACIHSDICGFSVNDVEETGFAWIILNWKLRVFSRPRWNTKLNVKTWSSHQKHISFYRDFEITDNDNNLVALATSRWVLYDLSKKSFTKIDSEFAKKYTMVDKHVFEEPFNEKIKEPESLIFVKDYVVSKRDLDTNHHVNNLNYLDFAYEALPVNIIGHFNSTEIMYKTEARLEDILSIYFHKSENDNEYLIVIKNKNTHTLHCIIKLSNTN